MREDAADHRPMRSDGVLGREASGRTVLLRLEDGSYYALDGAGGRIWELCDGERSLAQIALQLTVEFDVGVEAARTDVEAFVAELGRDGLIHLA